MFTLVVVLWSIMSILTCALFVGAFYAYFQRKYTILAETKRQIDSWTALCYILAFPVWVVWPIGIGLSFFLFENFRYGWKLPFTK